MTAYASRNKRKVNNPSKYYLKRYWTYRYLNINLNKVTISRFVYLHPIQQSQTWAIVTTDQSDDNGNVHCPSPIKLAD